MFPAIFFGQKMEVVVERIGFSAAEGGRIFFETFFLTKKKFLQGNFNQKGGGVGGPPPPPKRVPQIESNPRSAFFARIYPPVGDCRRETGDGTCAGS